jgi:hypothetical protein
MQNLLRNVGLILWLLFALKPAVAQYAAQQRLIGFNFNGNYENTYTGDRFSTNSFGTFSDENYQSRLYLTNTFTYQKFKTNSFATGYNFSLAFYYNSYRSNRIDSFNQVYEKSNSHSQTFNFGAGKSYRYVFPIGKKFGCDLSQNTNFFLGRGNSSFQSDSADGYNEVWNKYKNWSATLNANLNVGLYYWVAPRVVLNTQITIARAFISVSSSKVNGSTQDNTNVYYNSNFSFPFSNAYPLVDLSIGVSVLLK